jgi:hypothetical protein
MGKVLQMPRPEPRLPSVQVTVRFRERIVAAAKAAEQPVTGYIRMALLEKLERDGR